MLIIVLAVATILAFAGYAIGGRLAGISVTILCSALMAFFLMPPIFSLRVAQKHDIFALTFYGTAGLVLAGSTPSKKKRPVGRFGPACDTNIRDSADIDMSSAIEDLMSRDLGIRLRAVNFAVAPGRFSLPCTHAETLQILSDVLEAALQTPKVQQVSLLNAQIPGTRRLIVVAHCVWPPPQFTTLTFGKRDQDCAPANFPGWPVRARASWFDNGYDRIYQISIEV